MVVAGTGVSWAEALDAAPDTAALSALLREAVARVTVRRPTFRGEPLDARVVVDWE